MQFRIKNTVNARGVKGAKIHVQQYTDTPDKHGRYNFWCGNGGRVDEIEVLDGAEVTCGQCARLLYRRAQLQSIKGTA